MIVASIRTAIAMPTPRLLMTIRSPVPKAAKTETMISAAPVITRPVRARPSAFRHNAAGGEPRAPYCMMGICFDCLVSIDGTANRQSCQIEVAEGMAVQSQHGLRVVEGRIPE